MIDAKKARAQIDTLREAIRLRKVDPKLAEVHLKLAQVGPKLVQVRPKMAQVADFGTPNGHWEAQVADLDV